MNNTLTLWLATALFFIIGNPLSAQCDTVVTQVEVEDPQATYVAGSEDLNLTIFPVDEGEQMFPIKDQLVYPSTPSSQFTYRIQADGTCRSISDSLYPVKFYSIVPRRTATYEFARVLPSGQDQGQSVSLSVFAGIFDPAVDNCSQLLASSFKNPSPNQPNVVADLEAGKTYTLVVLPGSSPSVPYPRSYTLFAQDLSNNEGNPTFSLPVTLAPNYGYTYVAVNQDDNTVAEVADQGDFRSLPAANYLVYGINYDSATVAPLSFVTEDFDEIRFDDNGDRRCFSISESSYLLLISEDTAAPVDWLTFTATPTGGAVELFWDVAAETENDYFRVERSADGSSWTDIGEVAGNGTTQTYAAFEFTDDDPLGGKNYYRLIQVDFDGTEHLSTVVEATLLEEDTSEFTTYPNPFSNQFTVAADRVPEGEPRLFDLQGRDMSSDITVDRTGAGATIATDRLPAGMYLLRWGSQELRVIKN